MYISKKNVILDFATKSNTRPHKEDNTSLLH